MSAIVAQIGVVIDFILCDGSYDTICDSEWCDDRFCMMDPIIPNVDKVE